MKDTVGRFSNRVDNYVKYRPRYPDGVIDTLRAECGLTPGSSIADVGSGTGFLSELFLRNGNTVWAVEPNADMRAAAELMLADAAGFRSVSGMAEATTLPEHSVDLVAAGQAFHWFDRDRTRLEFGRILRSGGWVALIWNERETQSTPFLRAYEELLQSFATDYAQVDHRLIDDAVLRDFFDPGVYQLRTFPNRQVFDFAGVQGRLLSSSYAPEQGQAGHEPMLAELRRIFDAHCENDRVSFDYLTRVYYGQLPPR